MWHIFKMHHIITKFPMQNLLFSQKTALIGLLIWLIAVVFQFTTLQQEEWARLILLLAALVWLPLALPMISTKKYILEQALQYSILPSGILLAVGLFLPTGLLAAVLTFPWLLLTFLIALRGWHFFQSETRNIGVVAISAAHLFLIVGGAWTMADRLGIQPLNFDPAIVLLTGIHFHYAGFMFPFLAGLAAFNYPSVWLKVGCWLAVLAVPMTAAGITVMQLWEAPALEMSAAATVTLAGWSTAIGYLHLIQKNNKTGWVRFF